MTALLLALTTQSLAATLSVGPSGDYATLEDAVDAAEGGDVLVQRLFQIAEDRHPPGQVIQRGIGGVAGIAVRLAPLLPGLIIFRDGEAGGFQFGIVDLLPVSYTHLTLPTSDLV